MAGYHFKQTWPAKCEHSERNDDFTPKASDIPGHVRCDLTVDPNTTLRVDFSEPEVMGMLSVAFPTYMPTMDAVHRFMVSNPKTSAEMLAEIANTK
jgi:hypothetical protein